MRIHNQRRTIQERAEKPSTTETESDLLTVAEVARILRVDDTTVRRWIKDGALEAVALPHANKRVGYRIKKETMDGLFDQQVEMA